MLLKQQSMSCYSPSRYKRTSRKTCYFLFYLRLCYQQGILGKSSLVYVKVHTLNTFSIEFIHLDCFEIFYPIAACMMDYCYDFQNILVQKTKYLTRYINRVLPWWTTSLAVVPWTWLVTLQETCLSMLAKAISTKTPVTILESSILVAYSKNAFVGIYVLQNSNN